MLKAIINKISLTTQLCKLSLVKTSSLIQVLDQFTNYPIH